MRKFTASLLGVALLGTTVIACKETKEKTEGEVSDPSKVESVSSKIPTVPVFNANLATEDDLKSFGMTPAMINLITENRPFLTMNQLDSVLGPKIDKETLYRHVFVPFNLNTTAEEDFKMIPGVGDRMAHEFEEYRPYTSIQQFRKEIGKYVDEEEVARLENYVFVPVELNSATEEDILALPGVGKRMAHEFEEYRPYTSMAQFRKEIGKYVDDKELARLERLVFIAE